MHRESKWIIAENFKIKSRSRRFLIEIDEDRAEVAARKIDLLVLYGDGWITSEALALAVEEAVNMVIIGDELIWLEGRPYRDVEYLMAQYDWLNISEVSHKILNTYIRSAGYFLRKRRIANLNVKHLIEVKNLEEKYRRSREILEKVFADYAKKKIKEEVFSEALIFLEKLLDAEVLDAILRAGLTPHLSFVEDIPLYSFIALEFRGPLLWESVLRIEELHIENLKNLEDLRRIAEILKIRLSGLVPGSKRSYREAIRRRVKALASVFRNPLASYVEKVWK